jgi:hypothetical protein
MPKFHVKNTFEMPDRELFVMAGSVVEGEIQAGMFVRVPFNSALEAAARIHCIEYARHLGGSEDVCLCIKSEADEFELWRGLNICDEVLEVTFEGSD